MLRYNKYNIWTITLNAKIIQTEICNLEKN